MPKVNTGTTSASLPASGNVATPRMARPRVGGEFLSRNQMLGQMAFFQWKQPLQLGTVTPEKPSSSPGVPAYKPIDAEK